MMNCQDVQHEFDELLDGELDSDRASAVRAHVDDCGACARALDGERRLRAMLRDMPAPAPRPGFARQALRRARQAHAPKATGWFAAGFGSAAAAGLAAWLVFAPGMGPTAPTPDGVPVVNVALGQAEPVRLVFDAPARFETAELTMRLPANFELAGYPGVRELSWTTELEAGRNLLELPVRAVAGGDGELVAEIAHGDRVKRFRLRLQADGAGAAVAVPTGRA